MACLLLSLLLLSLLMPASPCLLTHTPPCLSSPTPHRVSYMLMPIACWHNKCEHHAHTMLTDVVRNTSLAGSMPRAIIKES